MEALSAAVMQVLHRRIDEPLDPAGWSIRLYWSPWSPGLNSPLDLCGPSCPCCCSKIGDHLGGCLACDVVDGIVTAARTVASFLLDTGRDRAILRVFLMHVNRAQLPCEVHDHILAMMTRGRVLAPAGLAGLLLSHVPMGEDDGASDTSSEDRSDAM